jgi:hypothetical protein
MAILLGHGAHKGAARIILVCDGATGLENRRSEAEQHARSAPEVA